MVTGSCLCAGIAIDPIVRPALHQFAGSKACWWEIADDLPRFEKWVPGLEPAWAKPA